MLLLGFDGLSRACFLLTLQVQHASPQSATSQAALMGVPWGTLDGSHAKRRTYMLPPAPVPCPWAESTIAPATATQPQPRFVHAAPRFLLVAKAAIDRTRRLRSGGVLGLGARVAIPRICQRLGAPSTFGLPGVYFNWSGSGGAWLSQPPPNPPSAFRGTVRLRSLGRTPGEGLPSPRTKSESSRRGPPRRRAAPRRRRGLLTGAARGHSEARGPGGLSVTAGPGRRASRSGAPRQRHGREG